MMSLEQLPWGCAQYDVTKIIILSPYQIYVEIADLSVLDDVISVHDGYT